VKSRRSRIFYAFFTHFLRIVRGNLLKGNSITQLPQALWPMLAFLFVAGFIALKRYRQTLD
jgi:ABC-2 type transport system permease protein